MTETIRIANDDLVVDIASLGAEMQSLAGRDGRQWLWHGDAAFWAGRSPILFPIVGKAPDNRIGIGGRDYDMNQHGFARRSVFSVITAEAGRCVHALCASDSTRSAYPFDFRLTVEHALSGRTLTVAAEVTSEDDSPLPFGIGFHPAFRWPLPGAEAHHHDIRLANGAEPALSRLTDGLRRPGLLASPFHAGLLALDPALFVEDAMIFPDGAGAELSYGVEGGPRLAFTFENLPNLALWTKPGAPFLCIEPWHGTAPIIGAGNDIALRPCSLTLPPGERTRFAFSVEIPA